MSCFHCHYADGRHVVCATTDGRGHSLVKGPLFKGPRQAIDFAAMRNRHVSPLRGPVDGPVPPLGPSTGPLTRS